MPDVPQAIVGKNAFSFRINNFQCNLVLPDRWGLTDILNQGANLYTGTLNQKYFQNEFSRVKQEKTKSLLELIENPTKSNEKYIDFQIKMLHDALISDWKHPALVVKKQDDLIWHTGGVRLLATGMVHTTKEKNLRLLVTDFDKIPTDMFNDVAEISNDLELCHALGVEYFDYKQSTPGSRSDPTTEIFLEWNDTPGPCLHYVRPNQNILDWSNHDSCQWTSFLIPVLTAVIETRKIYYTSDHQHQLFDSCGNFTLEWLGPSDIGQTQGMLNRDLFRHVKFNTPLSGLLIWVAKDHQVDINEILFWADTRYNVCIDREERFAAIFNHQGFRTKTISANVTNNKY